MNIYRGNNTLEGFLISKATKYFECKPITRFGGYFEFVYPLKR